jgi:hypothetical protein
MSPLVLEVPPIISDLLPSTNQGETRRPLAGTPFATGFEPRCYTQLFDD